ncbi:MAG TPA: class II glutamine amidotransferase [Acidimicrobiales bacterium]|nr:class II glutamine amidotransferase [Acidimicrobiales bacterium]
MCRWLAYTGPPIFLDTLLLKPDHSLIDQSLEARQNYVPGAAITSMFRHHALPTNGDGFGVGWYGEREFPGQYRDTRPAWNDANLRRISEQIRSAMFLAHVRAAIHGTISHVNCHPFLYGNWLFQYNGEINGFHDVKRDLVLDVAPELYPHIEGNADTELCFHLALTYGLADDAPTALAKMVGRVERARSDRGVEAPFRATGATTDGKTLYAFRYSSDKQSKTLYHSEGVTSIRTVAGGEESFPADGRIVVSEPLELGYRDQRWVEVPEWSLVTVRAGEEPVVTPFEPII